MRHLYNYDKKIFSHLILPQSLNEGLRLKFGQHHHLAAVVEDGADGDVHGEDVEHGQDGHGDGLVAVRGLQGDLEAVGTPGSLF